MAVQVIIGKGGVGTATAELLAQQGHQVRILSRSGAPDDLLDDGRIEHRRVDATDAAAIAAAAEGAAAIYNCANPAYHRWTTDWPPMAAAMLDAAEATGAVLVTMSNLYGYGPVDGPMTEDLPLATDGAKGRVRAAMWAEALDRHRTGRVRVTEARASDFFGPGVVEQGYLGERAMPRLLRGKAVQVLGDPEAPHSWTYLPDVARALVRLAGDERAWGRAWHVPTLPARSAHAMVDALCAAAGVAPVAVRHIPWSVVRIGGVVVPMLRELGETRYQWDRPFVLDASAHTATFGDEPTPIDEQLTATVAWWRARLEPGAASGAGRPTHHGAPRQAA